MRNTSPLTKASRATALAGTFLFGAAFIGGIATPTASRAAAVVCVNCSTVFSQLLQLAKEVETAATTYQQLQTQLAQYQDMLKQGLSLPTNSFSSITNDLQQLQYLQARSRAYAGQMADFDERFRSQYRDYDNYVTRAGRNPNYVQDNYRRWNEQGFDSLRTSMRASGMNVSAISDEDALLGQLVQRSQAADGRLQAIQAGNQIAAVQVQQMQKLRLLLNEQIQAQGNWYAQNIERQTANDAFRESFHNAPVRNSPAKGY